MRTMFVGLMSLTLLLATGCPTAESNKPAPGGDAAGMVLGTDFDGNPITVGKGELKGKGIYLTYFASW